MDVKRLKIELLRNGYTQQDIAEALLLTNSTICAKVNGKREFTCAEATKIADLCGMSGQVRAEIFLQ